MPSHREIIIINFFPNSLVASREARCGARSGDDVRNIDEYRVKNLAIGEGRWRIDWFGAVTYSERYRRSSQPLIEVQLSEIADGVSDLNQLPASSGCNRQASRQIRLPVGFLPMVQIGDVWRAGQRVDSPPYNIERFYGLHIDRVTTSIIKAGLSEENSGYFYLPLSHHPYHINHTHSYCLLVDHGAAKLVIPAVELVRFYFGSSGSLISRIFDAPFSAEKFWVNIKHSDSGATPTIDLAPGISGLSAADVARVAISRSARSAIELIGNSCISATANLQKAYPKAVFPFEGETDLVASGKWLPWGENAKGVFLVFKLLSCTHPFPFGSLRYTAERTTSSIQSTSSLRGGASSRSSAQEMRFLKALKTVRSIIDQEPNRKRGLIELRLDSDNKFPDLNLKIVSKVDPDSSPTLITSKQGLSVASGLSVGDSNTGDICTRPVDLVALEAERQSTGHLLNHSADVTEILFLELVKRLATTNRFHTVDFVQLDTRRKSAYRSVMPLLVNEDGEICIGCLTTDQDPTSIDLAPRTRNRGIFVALARQSYVDHLLMVPEAISNVATMPLFVELHVISDRSRSMRTRADIYGAIALHFSNALTPDKARDKAVTARSIRVPLHDKTSTSVSDCAESLAEAVFSCADTSVLG